MTNDNDAFESPHNNATRDSAEPETQRSPPLSGDSSSRFPDFEPEDETYPWQELPETIKGAVIEICKNNKVAVPIAAQAVLSAVSLACQDLIWVDRGLEIGERSVCSLYMLTVAESGSRKSRADQLVTSVIDTYDRKRRTEYAREKETADRQLKEIRRKIVRAEKTSDMLARRSTSLRLSRKEDAAQLIKEAEDELKKTEKELATLRNKESEHHKPRLRRVLYSKIPINQLERNLAINWPAAGLFSDEAAGILNSRGESDMSSLDSLWEGKAIDVVGRTARETFYIEDPRLTISLMVQPLVFDRFLENKGELAKTIGFMPRFLLSRPETPYGKRIIDRSEKKTTEWIGRFNLRVQQLLAYAHTDLTQRDKNRKTLRFTPAAQQCWDSISNEKERETSDNGRFFNEREFVNRYAEHVARLAALFHFFEHGKSASSNESKGNDANELLIPESTIKAANLVVDWYLNEFGRVFNPEVVIKDKATYVLKKLKRMLDEKNGGKLVEPLGQGIVHENCCVPLHDLRENCSRYGLKKTVEFRRVLEWVAAKGNIKIHPKGTLLSSRELVEIQSKSDFRSGTTLFRFDLDRGESAPSKGATVDQAPSSSNAVDVPPPPIF